MQWTNSESIFLFIPRKKLGLIVSKKTQLDTEMKRQKIFNWKFKIISFTEKKKKKEKWFVRLKTKGFILIKIEHFLVGLNGNQKIYNFLFHHFLYSACFVLNIIANTFFIDWLLYLKNWRGQGESL